MSRISTALKSAAFAFSVALWGQPPAWQAGVVQIRTTLNEPGSGFVVARRGGSAYILTAAHVVEGDPKPRVEFPTEPDKPYDATVRNSEFGDERGLALLVVAHAPAGLAVLREGNRPEVGDKVIVAGYPVEFGTFSVLDPSVKTMSGRDLFLTLEPEAGFSGGPVLAAGAVVGLVYGRGGSGKALSSASVRAFLSGSRFEWETDGSGRIQREAVTGQGAQTRTAGETLINPADNLTYVWIPEGQFRMGCSESDTECDPDEWPSHDVKISGFWMAQTEVTQAAWKRVMKSDPSSFKGDNRPVETVSWEDGNRYCRAIGGRLPTEAEWEYAARAGTKDPRYAELDVIAWWAENSGRQRLELEYVKIFDPVRDEYPLGARMIMNGNTTHAVGTNHDNAWGLHDMLGNVREWVADWYGEDLYKQSSAALTEPAVDPRGPSTGELRTLRGGSWGSSVPRDIRVSSRYGREPASRRDDAGFRCAGEFR